MRALITGGGGQLARDLTALLGNSAQPYSHHDLDITDEVAVDRAFADARPDIVFNCAAFHNLDVCERELDRAWEVNVRAVHGLARRGVRLVHVSTNYVFDGRRVEPYAEHDTPSPRSIYALTKLAGEHAALAYGTNALVVRTAGLYGLHGSASKGGNFVERMIARAQAQGHLRVVSDQRLQPTFTSDLALALLGAVEADATGLLHLTAGDACSWHEFTRAILALAGLDVPVEPTTTTLGADGVDRPLNGVLASTRVDALRIAPMRSWREGLADYMAQAGLAAASSRLE